MRPVGGRAPSRPSFTPEFTFFDMGGTVRSDGLEMTWQSNHAANPPLQVGEEVIAFLVRRDEPSGLQVQFGAYGLMRVQGGKVASANKEVALNLRSSDVAELHRKVQSLVAAQSVSPRAPAPEPIRLRPVHVTVVPDFSFATFDVVFRFSPEPERARNSRGP